jgi:hypothetical protein
MLVHALDINSGFDKNGATHLVEFTYADFTSATNTQTLTPFTLPTGWGIECTHVELPTPFVSSDGTLISTAITIGDGGSANRFLTSTELNAAGAYIVATKGGALTAEYVPTSNFANQIAVTATAAKVLTTHTAGRCRVFYRLTNPNSNNDPLPFNIATKVAQ